MQSTTIFLVMTNEDIEQTKDHIYIKDIPNTFKENLEINPHTLIR